MLQFSTRLAGAEELRNSAQVERACVALPHRHPAETTRVPPPHEAVQAPVTFTHCRGGERANGSGAGNGSETTTNAARVWCGGGGLCRHADNNKRKEEKGSTCCLPKPQSHVNCKIEEEEL